MRAIVVDGGRLALAEVAEPQSAAGEAVVAVRAFSLNRGEVRNALQASDGWRPGWDFAGEVIRSATDSAGPAKGARVVGMLPMGAWAERVAAPASMLAELPAKLSFEQASTLPVAGLTAVHSLRKAPSLQGRRVLVTGASGGVGVFAIQLASAAGAAVTAAIRNPSHEALVLRLGASQAAVGADLEAARAFGPYDLILESVGGETLGAALGMLAPSGTCVLFGASDTPITTFDASRFRAGGTSLYGLFLGYELQHAPPAADLRDLAERIAAGTLDPVIEASAPWEETARVAADLIARKFVGKAVLSVA